MRSSLNYCKKIAIDLIDLPYAIISFIIYPASWGHASEGRTCRRSTGSRPITTDKKANYWINETNRANRH
jgi:hypothetical protein